jgi:hypothetical protein
MKFPSNIVMLKDGKICVVVNILKSPEIPIEFQLLKIRKFHNQAPEFNKPFGSSDFGIFKVSKLGKE